MKKMQINSFSAIIKVGVEYRMTKNDLAIDVKAGLGLKNIATKYRCSETTIWRRCKKFNLTIPKRKHNLLCKKFGRLKVIKEYNLSKNGAWVCVCKCGKEKIVKADHLLNGSTKSCGCLSHDLKWKGCGEISGNYWNNVKRHAKCRQLKLTITIEDAWNQFLRQNRKCALTGLPLTFYTNAKDKSQSQTASLDRIDSGKGYDIENIQWIHKKIQKMKWDLEEQEFISFCQLVVDFKNERLLRQSNEIL